MTKPDLIHDHLRVLAEWSAALTPENIPADVRRRAGLILWDDFGAMLSARSEPEVVGLRRKIAESGGPGEATVFDGGAARIDRYNAALGNGSAADWCELDGGFRPVVCHAALYVLPALLAEAEATNARIDAMIASLIVGYETVARVARTFSFPALTLHPHGGLATIGAAAAIAHLRGHDAETRLRALTGASTLVLPGPFGHAVEGALIRNVWPGLCAQNGLRAVDWAEIGISGIPSSLSDVFCDILGAGATPEALSADLGTTWAVHEGYHKMHACCQYAHSTVEAVQAALADRTTRPDVAEIAEVRVETHEKALKLDNAMPQTTLAAKFSMQHITAASLLTGSADADAFHADTLEDAVFSSLRTMVTLEPFEPVRPPPEDRPSRVTIRLRNGESLVGECSSARGGPDRPFSAEEIREKGRLAIEPVYPKAVGCMAPILEGLADDRRWGKLVSEFTAR
ncbi:MmgE/PrpD family protein [Roseivivax marinus]|uniref:MmgE/PrpD family protein n=1 Tax=Roseivivax marinus TaxID=1379903 RepID=W4HFR7_9RHOB|nr:MmgE/PrpD family protein [Roseivivax marinus]ETW10976.1 MmgE/PrpD family protein [Roseivivax marinus]